MIKDVHVLLIGSLGVDDLLVRSELDKASFTARYSKAESLPDIEARLESRTWDLVIVGVERRFVQGLELIQLVKQSYPAVPVLVISAERGEERAVAAIKAGADDYILKDRPEKIRLSAEKLLNQHPDQGTEAHDSNAISHLAHSIRDVLYEIDIVDGTISLQDPLGSVFEPGEKKGPISEVLAEVVLPDDRIRVFRRWIQHRDEKEELWNCTYRISGKENIPVLVQDHGYIVRDDTGAVTQIIGVLMQYNGAPDAGKNRVDNVELAAAKEAQQRAEKRLQSFIDTARVIIILLSPEGTIIEWNREAEMLFGVTREKAIGQNYFDTYLPREEIERIKLEVARVMQGKQVVGVENHVLTSHNIPHLVQWNAAALVEEESGEVSILAIGSDVTDKRLAEQSLIDKEANLSAVIENTRDSIWSIDSDYRVLTINSVFRQKFEVLFGVDLKPGMRITDHVPEPARSFWLEHYNRALTGQGYVIQAQFEWGDEPRDFEISFNPMYREHRIFGVSVFARDITERVRDHTKLKHLQNRDMLLSTISRSFLNEPLEEIGSAIEVALGECCAFAGFEAACLVFEPETPSHESLEICHFRSQGFEPLFESLRNATTYPWWGSMLQGGKPISFNSPDDLPAEAEAERRLFASRNVTSGVILPLRSQDTFIGVLCFLNSPLQSAQSEDIPALLHTVGELMASAIDRKFAYDTLKLERMMLAARVEERTSELRTVNAELARAARMKDEFLANMSHELRTPLTAILGLTESLQEQIGEMISEKQRNALAVIDESGRHLFSLINDILDLSKIEAGHLTIRYDDHDVNLLCKSSLLFVRQMAMKKDIHIEYKNPDPTLSLYTDGTRLKQIIVNLLNNAVKFTPEGGRVELHVKPWESRDEIAFEVRDTGIGIDERNMSQLFKPFVQLDSTLARQYEGTGLGLALVASLTDMLGGNVTVESAVYQGSKFTVTLPMKAGDGEPSAAPDTEKVQRLEFDAEKPPRILLAEDNESNIFTIQSYLEDLGVQVVNARDGYEVLDNIREIKPDLVLMDIQMPGINGIETIRRIREEGSFDSTPIVALTALAMPGDKERCLNAGADSYLLKPLSLADLGQCIRELLVQAKEGESV